MENKEIYDTILIGKNPSIYTSSIYIQTYNMKQLLISEETQESLDFVGHDLISGVLDVESKEDLINILEEQSRNLECPIVNEKVIDTTFDKVFQVKCKESVFYCKTVIVDNKKLDLEQAGCYYALKDVQTKEAIEMLANGCRISFSVRKYVSELK